MAMAAAIFICAAACGLKYRLMERPEQESAALRSFPRRRSQEEPATLVCPKRTSSSVSLANNSKSVPQNSRNNAITGSADPRQKPRSISRILPATATSALIRYSTAKRAVKALAFSDVAGSSTPNSRCSVPSCVCGGDDAAWDSNLPGAHAEFFLNHGLSCFDFLVLGKNKRI